MMGSQRVTAHDLSEAFDVQQTQNSELYCSPHDIWRACWRRTLAAPRGRFIETRTQNVCEIWGGLRRQFAVPSLLSEIPSFKLRGDQLESDLSDVIILKNRRSWHVEWKSR